MLQSLFRCKMNLHPILKSHAAHLPWTFCSFYICFFFAAQVEYLVGLQLCKTPFCIFSSAFKFYSTLYQEQHSLVVLLCSAGDPDSSATIATVYRDPIPDVSDLSFCIHVTVCSQMFVHRSAVFMKRLNCP